eukprot:gene2530-2143_t
MHGYGMHDLDWMRLSANRAAWRRRINGTWHDPRKVGATPPPHPFTFPQPVPFIATHAPHILTIHIPTFNRTYSVTVPIPFAPHGSPLPTSVNCTDVSSMDAAGPAIPPEASNGSQFATIYKWNTNGTY